MKEAEKNLVNNLVIFAPIRNTFNEAATNAKNGVPGLGDEDQRQLYELCIEAMRSIDDYIGRLCDEVQGEDAEDEEMPSNVALIGTLEPGLTVKIGGIEVDILDMDVKDIAGDRGVLVLAHDVLFQKAFDEDNCNNWTKSSLRKYLNGEWLDNLKKSVPGENILPFKRDLTSDDGLDDYGTCDDFISLISCDEYRKYRKYIPNKSDWWWTLTAYSTPYSGYSHDARRVDTGGSLDNGSAYYGDRGVAPAFLLLPDTLVEIA